MYKEPLSSFDELEERGYQLEPDEILVEVKLDSILDKRGWSIADLSKKTGVTRQAINYIMNGTYTVGIDLALKIAKVLDVPVEEIFYLKDIAWFSRVKEPNRNTLYFDRLDCSLVEHEYVKWYEKTHGKQFIDQKTSNLITQKEKELWEQTRLNELKNNPRKMTKTVDIDPDTDKRKLPRILREYVEQESNERFAPVFHKVVKRIPKA